MSRYYFAKSTSGFYDSEIHGTAIPADSKAITTEEYSNLIAGISEGKMVVGDANGNPMLVSLPPPTPEQVAAMVSAARSAAYTTESDPIYFKAQRGEATMDEWKAKVDEIKARYPDGVMPAL